MDKFEFKKSFGQNFLKDKTVVNKIVNVIDYDKNNQKEKAQQINSWRFGTVFNSFTDCLCYGIPNYICCEQCS